MKKLIMLFLFLTSCGFQQVTENVPYPEPEPEVYTEESNPKLTKETTIQEAWAMATVTKEKYYTEDTIFINDIWIFGQNNKIFDTNVVFNISYDDIELSNDINIVIDNINVQVGRNLLVAEYKKDSNFPIVFNQYVDPVFDGWLLKFWPLQFFNKLNFQDELFRKIGYMLGLSCVSNVESSFCMQGLNEQWYKNGKLSNYDLNRLKFLYGKEKAWRLFRFEK
jgi:hypothetical protein